MHALQELSAKAISRVFAAGQLEEALAAARGQDSTTSHVRTYVYVPLEVQQRKARLTVHVSGR